MNQKQSSLAEIESHSHEDTFNAGREFAKSISAGDVIGLEGNLGSGKTVFAKGICDYFNVKDEVNSPTFILVNQYTGLFPGSSIQVFINHFDLYRIKSPAELATIDLDSFVNENSVCLIEWPEVAEGFFQDLRVVRFFHTESENKRRILI